MAGKSGPHGLPVAGFVDKGEVLPNGEPSPAAQMTLKRFVSIPLPGPTVSCHQPAIGSSTEQVT